MRCNPTVKDRKANPKAQNAFLLSSLSDTMEEIPKRQRPILIRFLLLHFGLTVVPRQTHETPEEASCTTS